MGRNIDTSEARKLAVDLPLAGGKVGARTSAAIRRTAFAIERDAKIIVAKDTTDLAQSISTDFIGDGRFASMGADIGPTVDYGDDVEYGTEPHVIRPKTPGGKLVFRGRDGQLVFVDEVNHPGTPPQPYMGPAFDRHAPGLERALGDIGEDVL